MKRSFRLLQRYRQRQEAVRGLPDLHSYINANRSSIASTPIVVIASQPDDTGSQQAGQPRRKRSDCPAVHSSCEQIKCMLQQQLAVRTVIPTNAVGCHVFPEQSNIDTVTKLADRLGSKTVIGVGSGTAIDIAKACCFATTKIYIPATYGAVFASSTPQSLLVDVIEEAVLPASTVSTDDDDEEVLEVIVEPSFVNSSSHSDEIFDRSNEITSLYAMYSVLLDQMLYQQQQQDTAERNSILDLIQRVKKSIRLASSKSSNDFDVARTTENVNLVRQVGALLQYGLDVDAPRSIPLALSASLLPTVGVVFEQQQQNSSNISLMEMMASMVPGLQTELKQQGCDETFDGSSPPTVFVTNKLSANDLVVQYVKPNQAVWQCRDRATDEEYTRILQYHSLL